jgi:glycosyltransferase involved in cell wall biosynthesis
VHCIPNGFLSAGDTIGRQKARETLGISGAGPIAGWVGRLSLEKGPDIMLEALRAADHEWRLSVVGEGPAAVSLQKLARDIGVDHRVTWHGAVSNAASLMRAFDAFVLSSRTEGTPITLLEAMNAGIPIIATSVGGVPDVVSGDHALLVPAVQPFAIAQALTRLRADPTGAAERARAAKARLESFDYSNWIAKVNQVYARVLENHAEDG